MKVCSHRPARGKRAGARLRERGGPARESLISGVSVPSSGVPRGPALGRRRNTHDSRDQGKAEDDVEQGPPIVLRLATGLKRQTGNLPRAVADGRLAPGGEGFAMCWANVGAFEVLAHRIAESAFVLLTRGPLDRLGACPSCGCCSSTRARTADAGGAAWPPAAPATKPVVITASRREPGRRTDRAARPARGIRSNSPARRTEVFKRGN